MDECALKLQTQLALRWSLSSDSLFGIVKRSPKNWVISNKSYLITDSGLSWVVLTFKCNGKRHAEPLNLWTSHIH